MKISVILPTYNERGNIVQLIQLLDINLKTAKYTDFEIIVVDDNSTDGTAEAVAKLQKDYPNIKIFVRKNERGLASAVGFGIKQATGDLFVFMDSDFNHDPTDVPRLLDSLNRFDVVVGSRYVKGGWMESSWIRHYLSLFFNLFVRISLGLKTKDNLSGFIAVKRNVLESLDLNSMFQGFGEYHIPFIYQVVKLNGYSVHEIPVIYQERKYGKSKFKAIENLINYSKTVFKVRSQFKSKKKLLNLETTQRNECPLCHSDNSKILYRYDQFSIHKCRKCTFVFLNPVLTENAVRTIYSSQEALGEVFPYCDHYFSEDDQVTSRTDKIFIQWLKNLEKQSKGKKLLDIGCGTGKFLNLAQGLGWDVKGVDFSTSLIKGDVASKVEEGDFLQVAVQENTFDVITMWDFLEHMEDPHETIIRAREWLKPGGLLVCAVPKQNSILEILAGLAYRLSFGTVTFPIRVIYLLDHPSCFTPKTLENLLIQNQFSIKKCEMDETDLERVNFPFYVKFFIGLLFMLARPFKLQNRMIVLAEKQ